MENKPCGLLSDAQVTRYFVGANSVLAVHQHPKRGKPLVEGDRGIFKDCAHLDGELLGAFLALPPLLSSEIIVLGTRTLGAYWARRPAESRDSINADLLIREVLDGLLQCFGLQIAHLPKLQQTCAG